MTEKKKHTCKFKRLRYKSGNVTLFCTDPDCNKKINPALAVGKRCICWRCGEEFILNEYSIRLSKPHCVNCHKGKDSSNFSEETTDLSHLKSDMKNLIEPTTSLSERLSNTIREASKQEDEI